MPAGGPLPCQAVELPGFHFHDLRHTGNSLATSTPGASLADLMSRRGHASTRGALIYQHTNQERDERIADNLSNQIKKGRDRARSQEEALDANEGRSAINPDLAFGTPATEEII